MTEPYAPAGRPQPGWGGAPPSTGRSNGLGTAALVLGILAVLTSWSVIGGILLGLLAVVLGLVGRGRVKRREADNGGVALAGVVLGVIGVALSAALIAFGVSLLNSDEGKQLRECVQSAGSDQAAKDRCAQQFSDSVGG